MDTNNSKPNDYSLPAKGALSKENKQGASREREREMARREGEIGRQRAHQSKEKNKNKKKSNRTLTTHTITGNRTSQSVAQAGQDWGDQKPHTRVKCVWTVV